MRSLLIYLLVLAALGAGLTLGFPEWFGLGRGSSVKASGRSAGPAPVVTAIVRKSPFEDILEALGTVQANESVAITSNRADHVLKVFFEDGQRVEQGKLLVEMNAEEEKAELAEAQAVLDERRLSHTRVSELFEQKLNSARDYETSKALLSAAEARVKRLQAAISDRQIRAPFAGVLGLRRVSPGAYLQPNTVVTTLDDLSVVKVDFTIPETWLQQVAVGMPIVAESDAFDGEEFRGEVRTIVSRLDPRTRAATIRARLPNPELALRPGMLLKIKVRRDQQPVLQVPEEALIPVGKKNYVLRLDEAMVVERREVQVGRRRVGAVEILDGLSEEQKVVVGGILKARPGSKVQEVKVINP